MIIKQPQFIYAIPALQRVKLAELVPIDGKLIEVTMHFPGGCNNLVHVAFGYAGLWLCPSDINDYISLNAATPSFPLSQPVKRGQYLWVEILNGDGVNPHTIQVLPSIEGEETQ